MKKTILINISIGLLFVLIPFVCALMIDNADIAETALKYNGQSEGECIDFVRSVLRELDIPIGTGSYLSTYRDADAREVSRNEASRGDIIQLCKDSDEKTWHTGMHTAIILSKNPDGSFYVIDSNSQWDGIVRTHKWNPYSIYYENLDLDVHIFRFGLTEIEKLQVDTASSQTAEQSATPIGNNFFGVIGDWFITLGENIGNFFADVFMGMNIFNPPAVQSEDDIQQSTTTIVESAKETTETTVQIPAPSKPSLTSPYNWYQSIGESPMLRWQGDSNSVSYYVTVNSSNTGNVESGWINSNSWKPKLPNQNYIYTWKVKAKNSQGVEGPWSNDSHFSTASTILKFEGEISFNPPSPSSAEQIKIFASTTGWGGVGITLRVSVNKAGDGSANGEWKILKELGVPKFNENDAPVWHTKDWNNGTYRVKVEAKGPGDPYWQNPAVIETTYTITGKSGFPEEVVEEIVEGPYTVCSPFVLPVDDKYLETAGVSKGKGIMTSAYFFLDEGAEIKAVISGKIIGMIHDSKPFEECPAFENFFLEDDNGIVCSYLLNGETLVEEGDQVSQGQVIAISDGGMLGFHLGNLQIYTERRFGEGPNDYENMDLLR
jgi:hypothetical protein